MSTGAQTSRRSDESRITPYIPGAPVCKTARGKGKVLHRRQAFPGCPPDVAGKIAMYLAESRSGTSVMLLSMVNKTFRAEIAGNVELWYKLYLHWRGVPRTPSNCMMKARGYVDLNPTVPRTLPNFRMKNLQLSTRMNADKVPTFERTPAALERAMAVYKRITVLQYATCCGACGTRRHATTAFWSTGMRLCKYCLQENLVSDIVLQEKYWVSMWSKSFVDLVVGKVFFFKEHGSARQRSEFSSDGMDFHPAHGKAPRMVWFFWLPHLAKLVDLNALREETIGKQAAARVLRAYARRAFTLRTLHSTKDKKRPTQRTEWHLRPDKRIALDKLRRIRVIDKQYLLPCIDLTLSRRMVNYEDFVMSNRALCHEPGLGSEPPWLAHSPVSVPEAD